MLAPLKEYKLDQIVTFEKSYSFSRACEGKGIFKHIHYGDIHTKLPYIVDDAEKLPNITESGDFITLNYGDILLADASEDTKDLGKAVCYLDSENTNVIAGLHTIPIRVNKEIAVPEYLINLFQTKRYRKFVWRMGTGVSVLGLSKTNLATYPVFLPSVVEQREVANNFIKLNKRIQLQQEKIDLLKEQKKGFMQKIFSQELRFKDEDGQEFPEWAIVQLKTVASIYDGTHQTPTYQNEGIKFLSVENIKNLETTKFISKEDYTKEFKIRPEYSDILMTRIGDIGTANIISDNDDYAYYVSLALIKCKSINPKYLVQEIANSQFQKELHRRILHVAFPKKINMGEIGECLINLPSSLEQEKIADFLSKFDIKIKHELIKLESLNSQKQACMQQMFI